MWTVPPLPPTPAFPSRYPELFSLACCLTKPRISVSVPLFLSPAKNGAYRDEYFFLSFYFSPLSPPLSQFPLYGPCPAPRKGSRRSAYAGRKWGAWCGERGMGRGDMDKRFGCRVCLTGGFFYLEGGGGRGDMFRGMMGRGKGQWGRVLINFGERKKRERISCPKTGHFYSFPGNPLSC